ncbi:MAG: DUF1080 domain-containing protein [Bryobacteraceae bacterium]
MEGLSRPGESGLDCEGRSAYTVKDGALTVNREGTPGTPGNRNSSVMSVREFGDFELEWEWKNAPGGNSGLFYRTTDEEGRPQWTAVEIRIRELK